MRRTLSSAFPRLARVLDPRGVVRWRDGATAAARDSLWIRPTSTSAVEEGWESHGDDASAMVEVDGPPLLPAALKAPDDLVALLSAADGEDLIDGVHRLSSRSEGIVELPEALERAVRVAVRDTGATHRQVKARGRSLLEALKSISRGMPSPDADDAGVNAWTRRGSAADVDDADAPADDDVLHANAQWGVRLSARKHKRMLEGLAANAALEASGSTKRGKGAKKPPKPSEAAAAYGPLEAAAYAITRLPMTFAAQQRVLGELRARAPSFAPETLLDFGAGPAPSLWAARRVFGGGFGFDGDPRGLGGGTSVALVDASPSMMAFTRRVAKIVFDGEDLEHLGPEMGFLSKPSGRPRPDPNPWGETGPVRTVASLRSLNPKASFDLVVAAYSLGEIAAGTRHERQQRAARGEVLDADVSAEKTAGERRTEETVLALWSRVAPGGAIAIIEPGTPRGSKLVRRARELILEREREATERRRRNGEQDALVDAHVVAPCQHDRVCPMDGLQTWCHFSQRVKRMEMHRQMLPRGKGAQHQDERFSYVIIRRVSREEAREETEQRAAAIASGDYLAVDDEEEDDDHDDLIDDESEMDDEEIAERRAIEANVRGHVVSDVAAVDEEEVEDDDDEFDDDDDEFDNDDEFDDEFDDDDEEDEDEQTLTDAVALASAHEWGRMVRPPIKRSGHVIVDLCDAEGQLSRQIIAKSNAWEGGVGKSGYKAARKSKWGDLWAYRDPRLMNETKVARMDELEDFFKDFEGVDANELQGMIPGMGGVARETPVGVGGAKRRGSTKRPAVVEEFMALEREHGIEELVKMMEAQEEGDDEEPPSSNKE